MQKRLKNTVIDIYNLLPERICEMGETRVTTIWCPEWNSMVPTAIQSLEHMLSEKGVKQNWCYHVSRARWTCCTRLHNKCSGMGVGRIFSRGWPKVVKFDFFHLKTKKTTFRKIQRGLPFVPSFRRPCAVVICIPPMAAFPRVIHKAHVTEDELVIVQMLQVTRSGWTSEEIGR